MKDNVLSVSVASPQPKTDALLESLDRFIRDRESLARQVDALDKIIQNIRQAISLRGETNSIPPSRPEEYRGMRAVAALEAYLRARRGMKIKLTQAVADLVTGGVDPGQPRGRKREPSALVLHTLKIALPNRTQTFGWHPEGFLKGVRDEEITVWLADTADVPKRRKRPQRA